MTIPALLAALSVALAPTPPMGWNSWDAYGFTIDEKDFKANVAVLAELKGYGWQYAVIDEGWYMKNPAGTNRESREYQLDGYGLLVPVLGRFPSAANNKGLQPLAEWVHQHGLKFGIHIIRGIPKQAVQDNSPVADSAFHARDAADAGETCPWDDGNYGVRDNAAGQAYYDSMFKLYAAWQVDFVKVDCIANNPYRVSEIRQIAAAIGHSGRPMVLSLSPGPTNISHADEVRRYAQLWRISNDIWDGWSFKQLKPGDDFPQGVLSAFDNLARWNPYTGHGHWPDADMLPFGVLGPSPGWGDARTSRLTPEEEQTQFVLWCIARSPLILGGDLTRMDALTRRLITHRRLISLDQGEWRSRPVAGLPAEDGDARVWMASRGAEETVVAVFNLRSEQATVRLTWEMLGLKGQRDRRVVDVMSGKELRSRGAIEAPLGAHGSALYCIQP
jgi:alpha-galactosidase